MPAFINHCVYLETDSSCLQRKQPPPRGNVTQCGTWFEFPRRARATPQLLGSFLLILPTSLKSSQGHLTFPKYTFSPSFPARRQCGHTERFSSFQLFKRPHSFRKNKNNIKREDNKIWRQVEYRYTFYLENGRCIFQEYIYFSAQWFFKCSACTTRGAQAPSSGMPKNHWIKYSNCIMLSGLIQYTTFV